ncbi:MAG: DUF2339 domain-containing protein [Proteobacteria bacterium]|nr:DUF2339 domain-containing protein [Pseudomonadota bacterium]
MHLILGVVVGFLVMLQFGFSSALIGCVVGALTAEVFVLRKRLGGLEKKVAGGEQQAKEAEQEVIFAPVAPPSAHVAPQRPRPVSAATGPTVFPGPVEDINRAPSFVDRFFASLSQGSAAFFIKVKDFFSTGNVVLKIGVIIVFFGVAFLLKYAAQRNMVPLELRLIGVALGGLALLGAGWWLRHTKTGYGLVLQGGGVGVLYLVVFGAAKLYGLLPLVLALAVMVGLVALSCLLAVLQDARALAVFGVVGGFLAPVLMSTGSGSHVMLFSYYALLNAGIFGIAWAKAWRELNLIGFLFTFAIGTLWGSSGYRPEHFATTEPFLLLFFLFYVLISILFAHRQNVNLRGFIDGPLVFGLPLVVSGLQYYLVRDSEYGMALSALGFGLFYLSLALFLWRRLSESMHLLCEAFLALGVVFGSLAIPLALDGHWSASIWALEGAGMVWVGARQQRVLARHFGLLLQIAAAFIFLDSVLYPLGALPFANRYFLGCLFLSLAALVSSYFLDRHQHLLKSWERYYPLPLLIWGLAWWYLGGVQEADRQFPVREEVHGFLLFCSATSILVGIVVRKLQWSRLTLALLLQLPAMVILVPVSFLGFHGTSHLLSGWGGVAWTIAFIVQYRILYLFADKWPKKSEVAWHLGSMWLLLFVVSHEAVWAVGQVAGISPIWSMICWSLVPSGGIVLLMRLAGGSLWPVGKFPDAYLGAGGALPAVVLVLLIFASFRLAGDPAPLPYLPLVNPLELSGLLAILILFRWVSQCRKNETPVRYLPDKYVLGLVGILLFFMLNSIVARTVHFFAGIPYYPDSLYHSAIFQAAIAALWGTGALAITIWATRRGSRTLWAIGAVLLAMVVVKLFLVDLSGTGTIGRIVSFLVVGGLMLIIGYFSPIPPKTGEDKQ